MPGWTSLRKMPDLLWVALIALVVHTAFLAVLPPSLRANESDDFKYFYSPVANNLLEGRGYVNAEGKPATVYPPGFPLILAGVYGCGRVVGFPDSWSLRLFAALMTVGSTLLVFLLARQVSGRKTARLTALLWIFYPGQLWTAKQPNSELPFLVLFFALVYWLVRQLEKNKFSPVSFLGIGLLAGLGCLIRPIAVGLFSPLVLLIFWQAKGKLAYKSLAVGLLLLGNLLAVAPWQVWLCRTEGHFVLLSTNGPASITDGLTVGVSPSPAGRLLPVPEDVKQVMQNVLDHQPELDTTGAVLKFMAVQTTRHPVAVLKLLLIKAGRAWYGTDSLRWDKYLLVVQLPFLILAGWGIKILLQRKEFPQVFLTALLLLTLYFWAMTVVALSILRYMIPVMGLLMIPAAVGVEYLGRWGGKNSNDHPEIAP